MQLSSLWYMYSRFLVCWCVLQCFMNVMRTSEANYGARGSGHRIKDVCRPVSQERAKWWLGTASGRRRLEKMWLASDATYFRRHGWPSWRPGAHQRRNVDDPQIARQRTGDGVEEKARAASPRSDAVSLYQRAPTDSQHRVRRPTCALPQ